MGDEYDTDHEPMTEEEEARLQAEIAADRDALARHYLAMAASGEELANSELHPY